MPSYVLPQVLVFQEFEQQPVAIEQPQNAVLVGEQFDLHRYPEEKSEILVAGSYDPTEEQCFAWPARRAGSVVDETYTKVFFDNALLKYFHDPSGDGSVVTHTGSGKNRIRAASKIFKTANSYTRSTELLRDVQVGDAVKLIASACASPVTFYSTVAGLVADILAAIVDPATSDDDNQAATTAAVSGSQTAGADNKVGIGALSGASYDGLPTGDPTEVYTIEVIGASTGGDATTAILKVTSASGRDNVAAVTPAAFASPTAIGTRGLTVTFNNNLTSSSSSGGPVIDPDDFLIGQKFVVTVSQAFTPPAPASGGTYGGESDTTYVAEVTRGGLFASSTKPQVTVSTTTGIDISGPTNVNTSGGAVPIGTQGTTIAFTGLALNKGDRYYVPVIAERDGAVRTLVLANNLPEALRGVCDTSSSSSSSSAPVVPPDLDLTLYIKKNIEVSEDRTGFAPLVNWEQSETEICIQAGIIAYDASWALGGVLQPLDVEDGKIYIHHRDRVFVNADTVGSIDDVGGLAAALGTVHPDNPLSFGVFKALENANGEEVRYLGLHSSSPVTLEDWLTALDILVGRDDVYSLVPLTQDKDVLDAFVAHCESQSTEDKGRWRICWLNMAAQTVKPIYVNSEIVTTDPLLATITDDPDTSGTQHTLVESPGEEFVTKGVRAGDTLRAIYTSDGFGNFTYTEFVIDAVINEETLRLFSGPAAAVNVPSKIEIHRTLTKNELAAELATNPGLFHSRRAYLVWPDQVGNAGLTFPGYFLCATLAGLRGGVLPHQGLTNMEILGYDDLSRTVDFFSATQLDTLAASGYWIVTQDPSDGTVFTRHQLSTGDQDDLNQKEQNITTNLDNISKNFLLRMKTFIGRGNVTPTMIQILRGEIISLIEQFKNTIINDRLGPQIISADILELRAHPTLRDRIVARIDIELPFPFNNLELHLIA
jgi:hypothetical protein